MDVGQALGIAWRWMVRALFKPFRFRVWLGMSFVAFLAGANGGMTGFNTGFNMPGDRGDSKSPIEILPLDFWQWVQRFWPFLLVGILVLAVLSLLFAWLISVFNVVFVDDVARRSGAIREPFARLKGLGTSYFLWQLGFGFIIVLLAGVPLALVTWVLGLWELSPDKWLHVGWAVPLIALLFYLGLVAIIALIVQSLTSDFALVIMYARNLRIISAWKALLPILKQNLGQIVLYIVLRVALTLGAGVVGLVATLVTLLVFFLPLLVVGMAVCLIWATGTAIGQGLAIGIGVAFGLPLLVCAGWFSSALMLPAAVLLRSLPMAVLGQVDPSLVTIPVGPESLQPPEFGLSQP